MSFRLKNITLQVYRYYCIYKNKRISFLITTLLVFLTMTEDSKILCTEMVADKVRGYYDSYHMFNNILFNFLFVHCILYGVFIYHCLLLSINSKC